MTQPLLKIEDLVTVFPDQGRDLAAVDGLDLSLDPGEVLGLVGESGCGKTVASLSVMGLVPPPGRVARGKIFFQGRDLLTLSPAQMGKLRGAEMGMIFQEPMTSLNPVFTVGRQVAEAYAFHRKVSSSSAWERAVEALHRVGIPDPARRASSFPHQLSGGMRQRALIAMALILDPQLVIADEPTTALDVTIQAQILRLLRQLQAEIGAAVLLVSHNLAVVAEMAARVAVMYTGRLVEEGPVLDIFKQPLHPYTQGLLDCLPARSAQPGSRLPTIPGMVPALGELPQGCAFSDRCPRRFAPCAEAEPALVEVAPGRRVACFLHHQEARPGQGRAA